MTEEDFRLSAIQLAMRAINELAGVRISRSDLATRFAGYCSGDPVRLEALRTALGQANSRNSVDDILTAAEEIMSFVRPPKATSQPTMKKVRKSKAPRHPA